MSVLFNYILPLTDGNIISFSFAIVGFLSTLSYLKSFLYGFYKHFIRQRRNLFQRYGGGWALVTGSSYGIGETLSYEFAKAGFNIILMSRT